MTTDALLYAGAGSLTLGSDGYRPVNAALYSNGCCPEPFCAPVEATICTYIGLLPTGPLWDKYCAEAQRFGNGEITEVSCASMALYALYIARFQRDAVGTILWQSIRESDPETARETIDDWLDRYGWQDCFRSYCRSAQMGELSPYEHVGSCGVAEYCPTNFDAVFELALKHNVLRALERKRRGFIKNLDGINWVIEPLGAALRPVEWPDSVQCFLDGTGDEATDGSPTPCFCDEVEFELCQTVAEIDAAPPLECNTEKDTVTAQQEYICDGVSTFLYPGVIAAECIVRSILRYNCPNIINRCDPGTGPAILPPVG